MIWQPTNQRRNMIITEDGETVEFKSDPYFFWKEKDNLKCNTERVFISKEEEKHFVNSMFGLLNIRIKNAETLEFFTRTICDISYEELLGTHLYIISWMPQGASEP